MMVLSKSKKPLPFNVLGMVTWRRCLTAVTPGQLIRARVRGTEKVGLPGDLVTRQFFLCSRLYRSYAVAFLAGTDARTSGSWNWPARLAISVSDQPQPRRKSAGRPPEQAHVPISRRLEV